MIRKLRLKRTIAFAAALMIASGVSGSALAQDDDAALDAGDRTSAAAQIDDTSDSSAADGDSSESDTEGKADGQVDEEIDMTKYRERLGEIAKEQKEIDKELEQAQKDLDKEALIQKNLSRKINSVNEEIRVSENYIDELDTQIADQQKLVDDTNAEITQGVTDFKGRLRAMYLAGSEGYTDIILNSGDFFDVLMRTELIKRVADHDKNELDRLVELEDTYQKQKDELDKKQTEYKEQLDALNEKKSTLDELYSQSVAAQQSTEELQEKLKKQNKLLESEKSRYGAKLSDFLKDDYGEGSEETGRMQTELAAANKLKELWAEELKNADKDDKDPDKDDELAGQKGKCGYVFGWPCPSTKLVTSGVGARWGTIHKGLDIGASMGSEIVASEGGTVVIASNTCDHNYGKDGSCGCGGGYGNYVVINHGNGFLTLYGHLTKAEVSVGEKVDKGDRIGISGTTGWSTGPHLHFELRYGGNYMNPLTFVHY